ncbi:hypothetical protein GCM10025882_03090 [Acinetobacter gyllenbergii]|uniref:Uncharacterized protein n=1 Tax=Acinetobacter gyllenbergii CIP 110306 = MTCC 11365 TaxID=1217657 RepID=A0A829HND0_9GAMM|nr:hypothetical protein [Acinetobacter gyllenbergii]EPF94497.1 hypothetical protein F957_00083 [Acinetobacter gyllenbergii CIP 110306 = MTCC 11365]EPH32204.1 hypothetical protein L293_1581 [Acinetobacter gyllenbergii CIP 110306 = MTCC 11365]ESK37900.1 hypothetical protein F987_03231 [Acinetobacter gyllenbergii NIPH 230]OBY74021.1 hypothetical protein NG55_09215 [Acinetobacter gyllenbergii]GMA09885.1 hypothetical protein GCM10025882_03090 [Acinetobacter gyllenbergii]
MSVKPYDAFEIDRLVKYYRNIPNFPKTSQELYLDDAAMMAGLYIDPISNLEDRFRDIFVFSEYKKPVDIKQAQTIGGVDQFDIQEIAYFISDILVHEKYHTGLFGSMIINGVIENMICRLETLLQDEKVLHSPQKSWWKFWR